MIRVLVAEDSAVAREYLVHLIGRDSALEVAGQARDGQEAVELVQKLRPHVVLMDIQMPRMDGHEATRRIMERTPTPIVMVSAHDGDLEERAFDALSAGALVVLNKPAPGRPDSAATALELTTTVRLMAEVKVVRRWAGGRTARPKPASGVHDMRNVGIVAIGASAGGPPVLAEILAGVGADVSCPILVVQHISAGFSAGLAEWLDRATPLKVKLAEPGEVAGAGCVYVAPDHLHMGIREGGTIELSRDAESDGFRPSVTHLMRSVARSYGRDALGVVLTGMGRDGASGLLELRRAGGLTIAQDEESSAVFGMPMEAVRLGAAEKVLPPGRIARTIRSLTRASPAPDRWDNR